jgi:hypothetical protein
MVHDSAKPKTSSKKPAVQDSVVSFYSRISAFLLTGLMAFAYFIAHFRWVSMRDAGKSFRPARTSSQSALQLDRSEPEATR